MKSNELTLITLVIAAIIILTIFGPLATIWSLNSLFTLGISYSLKNWFAMLWIQMLVVGSRATKVNRG